jgi:hypothetical protein
MQPDASVSRRTLVLVFLILVAFLAATYSFRRITDTELNSFQTRALVRHGDIHVERYDRIDNRPAYFAVRRDGHRYSIYGVGVSLVVAPIYVIATRLTGSDSILQAAAAIPFVAAAIVLMFLMLTRLVRPEVAAGGAVVFGFGTTMWPVASMGFFQHGPVALFQILGLIGLFSERPRAAALSGFGFAAAAFIRPPVVIPLILVGLYYLVRERRRVLWYAVGSLVPLAGVLIQNRWIWGSWLEGGYSESGIGFHAHIPTALWGLTFGLWRGLFVYSPVLIVGFVGWVMVLRRLQEPVESKLAVLGVSSLVTILFYSTWTTWWNGENQFGYRYLLDVVPFLVVLGAYAIDRSDRVRRTATPLGVLSVLTMTWGAAPNNFGWDGVKFATRFVDTSLGQAWIEFAHRPWWGILRLAGVAAIAAMFLALSRARSRVETAT